MIRIIFLIVSVVLTACNQKENSQTEEILFDETMDARKITDSMDEASKTFNTPVIDTAGHAERLRSLEKMKIEIKTFANEGSNGFGYDIIMDGKTYVHQPNIPAVAGNSGFSTEEKARKAAGLVVHKIKNNIMPPTVTVEELDSLNVR